MNERIREFEKQCWDNQTNHLDTEKFAELIVLDICTLLETAHLDKRLQSNWDDSYLKLLECTGKGFSTFCREHFGVE